jgi:hypothetical protein
MTLFPWRPQERKLRKHLVSRRAIIKLVEGTTAPLNWKDPSANDSEAGLLGLRFSCCHRTLFIEKLSDGFSYNFCDRYVSSF